MLSDTDMEEASGSIPEARIINTESAEALVSGEMVSSVSVLIGPESSSDELFERANGYSVQSRSLTLVELNIWSHTTQIHNQMLTVWVIKKCNLQ